MQCANSSGGFHLGQARETPVKEMIDLFQATYISWLLWKKTCWRVSSKVLPSEPASLEAVTQIQVSHRKAHGITAEELCSFSSVPGLLLQAPTLTAYSWPSKFNNFKY